LGLSPALPKGREAILFSYPPSPFGEGRVGLLFI